MSYRCQVCRAAVPHRTPLRRYTVYRNRVAPNGLPLKGRDIAAEVPVCEGCAASLVKGVPLSSLAAYYRRHPVPQPPKAGSHTPKGKPSTGAGSPPKDKAIPLPPAAVDLTELAGGFPAASEPRPIVGFEPTHDLSQLLTFRGGKRKAKIAEEGEAKLPKKKHHKR